MAEAAQSNPVRTDFLSRAAVVARDGLDVLRRLEALANDYADLGYAPDEENAIVDADVVGTLNGMSPADITTAVQGIAAIGGVLSANNGALRKAFKRLSSYAR
jgi:hypothetical protein